MSVVAAAAMLSGGCGTQAVQRAPVASDDGIQLTGTLSGRQIHVTDGEPEVVLGDCDPNDGVDEDLCIVTFTIDGAPLALVVENPAGLAAGERLPVVEPAAAGCLPHCDDLTGGAVIEVRRGQQRQFATSGSVVVREAGSRYAATFVLGFGKGRVTGAFNVGPAPDGRDAMSMSGERTISPRP
ncbi:MAG: hypothetical protein M3N57_10150 [Actinomycetota bacterium]|nr:hypothetical protein [Actinomycetota bacterium]